MNKKDILHEMINQFVIYANGMSPDEKQDILEDLALQSITELQTHQQIYRNRDTVPFDFSESATEKLKGIESLLNGDSETEEYEE